MKSNVNKWVFRRLLKTGHEEACLMLSAEVLLQQKPGHLMEGLKNWTKKDEKALKIWRQIFNVKDSKRELLINPTLKGFKSLSLEAKSYISVTNCGFRAVQGFLLPNASIIGCIFYLEHKKGSPYIKHLCPLIAALSDSPL